MLEGRLQVADPVIHFIPIASRQDRANWLVVVIASYLEPRPTSGRQDGKKSGSRWTPGMRTPIKLVSYRKMASNELNRTVTGNNQYSRLQNRTVLTYTLYALYSWMIIIFKWSWRTLLENIPRVPNIASGEDDASALAEICDIRSNGWREWILSDISQVAFFS